MGYLFAFALATSPYAEHAPGSARSLQTLIADTLDIYTYNVETDQRWATPSTQVAWAFLNVGSFHEGKLLIERIGQVCFGAGACKRNGNATVGAN